MSGLEDRLAAIGFRVTARVGECWRVQRVGTPFPESAGRRSEPDCSEALAGWLARLRGDPQPQTYRVRPASRIRPGSRIS